MENVTEEGRKNALIRAYKNQIINGITDLRIILFKNDDLFIEINPNTYGIRPMNSIFWEIVDKDIYFNLFNYFRYYYHKIINLEPNDLVEIGTLSNNIFAINIDVFDTYIKNDVFFNIDRIYEEYQLMLKESDILYKKWYNLILKCLGE